MGTHDDEAGSSISKHPRQYETVEEVLLPQIHHEFLLWEGCSREAKFRLGLYQAVELDEEGFNVYFEGGLRSDEHFNTQEYWLRISRENNLGLSKSHTSTIKSPILRVIHKMITYDLCQRTNGDLDRTMLRDLIDYEGRLIPEDPQHGVPRVGIPRLPRASMQDMYDRMGMMEIRLEAIKRMEYRQSCHWDMYQGVFEHMAGVYSVPL
nr:hypothetical protein [Tanacetum cinerariifolium]